MNDPHVRQLRPAAELNQLTVSLHGTADLCDLIPGGEHVTAPVAYDDDIWNLAGHPDWKDRAGGNTKIVFTRIPHRWRDLAKLWALASLDPSLVEAWTDADTAGWWTSYKEPLRVTTAQGNVKALGLGLQRLAAENLHEIDDDGWALVTTLFRQPISRTEARVGKTISAKSSKLWADQLRSLHTFGPVVGCPDPFGSEPWGEADLAGVFNTSANVGAAIARQNSIRPHEQVGHLLGYAAFVIDELADDIISHATWWLTTHRNADVPPTRDDGKAAAADLLRELAHDNGGHVPRGTGSRPAVAHGALAFTLGLDDADEAYQWFRQGLRDAQRTDETEYALDADVTPCPLPVRKLPHVETGELVPWTNRLLWDQRELHRWWSTLLYSCAIYLCATLGLRNNDRDFLSADPLKPRTLDKDGVPLEVWDLHGWRQKQRMAPKRAHWPAGHRVRRTIQLLQKMHALLDITPSIITHTNEPRLFDYALNLAVQRGGRDGIHLDGMYVNTWVKEPARMLQEAGVITTDLGFLPEYIGEKVIRITTLQAYASRDLGMIMAAAIGQWDGGTAVMGGYVGTITADIVLADDDEAEEVAAVQRAARLQLAAERDAAGEFDQSPGRERLRHTTQRFAEIENRQPLTRNRAAKIGRQALHVEEGPYTTCFFQEDGALCGGRGSADWRLCRPGACRNSAQSTHHRARLEYRRRRGAAMGGIYVRNAAKIAADSPDLEQEFAHLTDDELLELVKEGVEHNALTFLKLLT